MAKASPFFMRSFMQLTVRANAKINWALDIVNRRADGYHEMDMLMQSIDLCDDISLAPARFTHLTVNDRSVANMEKNLIYKAVRAINDYTGEKRAVKISVNKRIPVRAGLGGGSADCAATLWALNEIWRLRLSAATLMKIGLTLGADVPYCLAGGFCRVRGIGEKVEEVTGASENPLVICHVGEGLSTQAVFSDFDEHEDGKLGIHMENVIARMQAGDFRGAQGYSGNALERAANRLMPEIGERIQSMYALGAVYARMSGSGSAVYGVFESTESAAKAASQIPGAFCARTVTTPSRL